MSEIRSATRVVDDLLESGYRVRLRVTGGSMTPWLPDGAVVTLSPLEPGSARIGDLLLFRAGAGNLVLHRLVARCPGSGGARRYLLKGDALSVPDEEVREQQILGKVVAVARGPVHGGGQQTTAETAARRAGRYLIACASRRAPRLSASLARKLFFLLGSRPCGAAPGGGGAAA